MSAHFKLVILILALTLDGQVYAGEIIGGHEAVPHSRPYMAIVEQHKPGGGKRFCDGFLLNEEFVMTAAHCQGRSYTVLLGAHYRRDCEEITRVSVQQSFPHKDYNATGYRNDIMLLKLSSKVIFSKNIAPIVLADRTDITPESCMVSGWGKTDMNSKSFSPALMEVNVTLSYTVQCPRDDVYCSVGEVGPAPGDSGGPLVCENSKAYGVVSAGHKPSSDGPSVATYTKIPDYKSWIDWIMQNNGINASTDN